jgi:hypothetical protein
MTTIPFGKHKGRSLHAIATEHPRWIAWACLTAQLRKFLADNSLTVRVVLTEPEATTTVEIRPS